MQDGETDMWDILLEGTELEKKAELTATDQLALALAAEGAIGKGKVVNKLALMKRRRDQERAMDKTAGLFMKPSDIADHTNLARELENKLNGQAPADDPMFKKANNMNMAVGAGIGSIAGGLNAYRYSKKEPKKLAPAEETKGFYNKAKRKFDEIDNNTIDFASKNPKKAIAMGAVSGGVAGGLIGSDLVKRYKRMKRKKPSK